MTTDWAFSICHTYKSSQLWLDACSHILPCSTGESPAGQARPTYLAAESASGFKILTEKSEVKNGELDCRIWRIFQVIFEVKQYRLLDWHVIADLVDNFVSMIETVMNCVYVILKP